MLLRGYGVEDKVGQLRADLEIKGDSPDQGLASLRVGALLSEDEKDTALYSNDGGTGCATCGYNNVVAAKRADRRYSTPEAASCREWVARIDCQRSGSPSTDGPCSTPSPRSNRPSRPVLRSPLPR